MFQKAGMRGSVVDEQTVYRQVSGDLVDFLALLHVVGLGALHGLAWRQ